jgi:hypothetical protein
MNTKFAYQEKIAASMSNLSEEYLAMVKLENKLGKEPRRVVPAATRRVIHIRVSASRLQSRPDLGPYYWCAELRYPLNSK